MAKSKWQLQAEAAGLELRRAGKLMISASRLLKRLAKWGRPFFGESPAVRSLERHGDRLGDDGRRLILTGRGLEEGSL